MNSLITSSPAISVVMPLYNKEREVARAIRSVLAQTFIDFELVVVDDGSTDNGPVIVAACDDPRVRMIRQPNAGVSAARNRGIAEARADLIAFLDADDEWLPEFLVTILRLRERFPACMVYATRYFLCYEGHEERAAVVKLDEPGFQEGVLTNYFQVASHSDPPLCSSAVAVDKAAILDIGGFPVGIIAGEDLLAWARLAARFEIAYCTTALARFYAPMEMSDRPPRIPQQPDRVAQGLSELLEIAPPEKHQSLKEYLALWHRMRAVVFIKLNLGVDARQEIRKARGYIEMNSRLWILEALSWLPGTMPSRGQILLSRSVNLIRSWSLK